MNEIIQIMARNWLKKRLFQTAQGLFATWEKVLKTLKAGRFKQ